MLTISPVRGAPGCVQMCLKSLRGKLTAETELLDQSGFRDAAPLVYALMTTLRPLSGAICSITSGR